MEAYVSEQKPHALSSTYRYGYNLYFEIELTVFLVICIDLIGRYKPTAILDQVQDTNIYLEK
jgi:hypothetical protein